MASELESFSGTVQKGTGSASGNLSLQIPLIAKQFPEISGAHPGTINVQLDFEDFRVAAPDFITTDIDWREANTEDAKTYGPEVFHLTRICIQPSGRPRYCAWLYGPQQSSHRDKRGYIEVVSPTKIVGLEAGTRIEIFINGEKVGPVSKPG